MNKQQTVLNVENLIRNQAVQALEKMNKITTEVENGESSTPRAKSENSEKNKIKIKYAKEFFINEKGEVIKMAAILTHDETILEKLKKDK